MEKKEDFDNALVVIEESSCFELFPLELISFFFLDLSFLFLPILFSLPTQG